MTSDTNSPTDVVTAFLVDSENRILLLKRSQSVRTYSGKWAAVSGYLETYDPLLQSEIEIREEVGFSRSDFSMARRGNPLLVNDSSNDRNWRVHPFSFRYGGYADAVELSDEHDEFRWDDPAIMETLSTVPELLPTWNCVKP